jgi:hypothetical protein
MLALDTNIVSITTKAALGKEQPLIRLVNTPCYGLVSQNTFDNMFAFCLKLVFALTSESG